MKCVTIQDQPCAWDEPRRLPWGPPPEAAKHFQSLTDKRHKDKHLSASNMSRQNEISQREVPKLYETELDPELDMATGLAKELHIFLFKSNHKPLSNKCFGT